MELIEDNSYSEVRNILHLAMKLIEDNSYSEARNILHLAMEEKNYIAQLEKEISQLEEENKCIVGKFESV